MTRKEYLSSLNLSIRQLSQLSTVSHTTIRRWIKNEPVKLWCEEWINESIEEWIEALKQKRMKYGIYVL